MRTIKLQCDRCGDSLTESENRPIDAVGKPGLKPEVIRFDMCILCARLELARLVQQREDSQVFLGLPAKPPRP